jgi:hypothetical protein
LYAMAVCPHEGERNCQWHIQLSPHRLGLKKSRINY